MPEHTFNACLAYVRAAPMFAHLTHDQSLRVAAALFRVLPVPGMRVLDISESEYALVECPLEPHSAVSRFAAGEAVLCGRCAKRIGERVLDGWSVERVQARIVELLANGEKDR